MASINDLSDDILYRILSYIDIVHRQRLEVVCKRWKSLIRLLWSKISKLSFEMRLGDIYGPEVRYYAPDNPTIIVGEESIVGEILKICENNLTELSILSDGPDIEQSTDKFIPLRKCIYLRTFSIQTYDNILIQDCLESLPTESLEDLSIWNAHYEFDEELDKIIEEILMQAEGLTSLILSGVSLMTLEIIGMKSGLKSLELGNSNESLELDGSSLDTIKLVNLESLTICEERMVEDKFLIEVAKNCEKLREIKLYSETVMHDGLKALETLPNLRCVDLMIPKEIEILNYFSNLEEFYCDLRDRRSVTEETLTKFLERSPNLRKCYFNHYVFHDLFYKIAAKAGTKIEFQSRRCT